MRQLAAEAAAAGETREPADAALAAVAALDPKTAEVLLEEEVREAVLGTAGTAAGAPGCGGGGAWAGVEGASVLLFLRTAF